MSADSLTFRDALSRLAAGVSVITAKSAHTYIGITVSSFGSLSLKPPLILFCLDNASRNLSAFKKGGTFAVNLLTVKQKAVAQHFAAAGNKSWAHIEHEIGENGTPILNNTLAALTCTVSKTYKEGDHTIVIGAVTGISLGDKNARPLLYFRRNYHALGIVKK